MRVGTKNCATLPRMERVAEQEASEWTRTNKNAKCFMTALKHGKWSTGSRRVTRRLDTL